MNYLIIFCYAKGNFILKNHILEQQTKNLPTKIGLDLPPLTSGATTTKPFKYSRNSLIQFSLGKLINFHAIKF
jgi:hypothetical protein